jgi:hypothetical protein
MDGFFQPFWKWVMTKKARCAKAPPRSEISLVMQNQGASFFMDGTKPIWVLPLEPWVLTMFRVFSEVVPQQSFFGQ